MEELKELIQRVELATLRICELSSRMNDEDSDEREEAAESLRSISDDLRTASEEVDLPEYDAPGVRALQLRILQEGAPWKVEVDEVDTQEGQGPK